MTATIPPTPAPSRRRTGEAPRAVRRRVPEAEPATRSRRNATSARDTTGNGRSAKAGTTVPPGRRRTAKTGAATNPGVRRAANARTADAGRIRVVPGRKRAGRARSAPEGDRTRALSRTAGSRARRIRAGGAAPEGRPTSTSAGRLPRRATPPRARTPFVLLVVGLLAGALVSLLLLNTVLAQDAFTLSELQRGNQRLSERAQALNEDVNRESSPENLHARARSLGMRDVPRPAFIDARTGRVVEGGARPPGVPDNAAAAMGATAVTGAPGAIVPPPAPPRSGRTEGGTR